MITIHEVTEESIAECHRLSSGQQKRMVKVIPAPSKNEILKVFVKAPPAAEPPKVWQYQCKQCKHVYKDKPSTCSECGNIYFMWINKLHPMWIKD
jgi:hypothetical protein